MLAMYAELQSRRGDLNSARRYFDRALAIEEHVFGRSHPVFADTEARLARVLVDTGDSTGSLAAATEAENVGREHLRLMLRYLPERQSLSYAARRPRGLDLILSLMGSAPDAALPALDALIRSRALVLDEMAERRREAEGSSEDFSVLRARLASAQQRLANLVVRGPDAQTPADWAALVEAARSESERAESALADRSAPFRAERDRLQLGFEQVRDTVPRLSALVSFVRYDRVRTETRLQAAGPAAQSGSAPRTIKSYVAFIIKRHEPPIVVPLGPAAAIDPLVARWRAALAGEALQATIQPTDPSRSERVSGTALRRLIWDPIADYLGDVGNVFIVPDGTLSLIPFAALPVGRAEYLLENGPVIHYLSAERDVVSQPGESSTVGRGLLALGGPAFDDQTLFVPQKPARSVPKATLRGITPAAASGSGCADFRAATFASLPGTLQEARDVANVWSDSAAAHSEGRLLLVARDANERALKQSAPGRRVLHLATHGFFVGGPCLPAIEGARSVGGLVPASPAGSSNTSRTLAVENPLLLSGLALAGANRRATAGPGDEDGILTAEEVATLNLQGVEWAVLSACDTGVGELKGGEGVLGLRRAFQIAGARTVIMSLWSVDDQATRAWMRRLYEGRFQKSLTTAEAVREASLSILRARRFRGQSTAPFYWAAFVAAGDWR